MSNIQVYVSTYSAYNSGSLRGEWVDLEQFAGDEEGFIEYITALHNHETDPEFMFQDYEGFPAAFYSESGIDSRVFEWLELDASDREKVLAFLDCFGDCAGDVFEAADNAYQGTYASDLDFAYEIVESCYNLEEPLASYFDYEKYARDLMVDYSSSNGFYFSSNW